MDVLRLNDDRAPPFCENESDLDSLALKYPHSLEMSQTTVRYPISKH